MQSCMILFQSSPVTIRNRTVTAFGAVAKLACMSIFSPYLATNEKLLHPVTRDRYGQEIISIDQLTGTIHNLCDTIREITTMECWRLFAAVVIKTWTSKAGKQSLLLRHQKLTETENLLSNNSQCVVFEFWTKVQENYEAATFNSRKKSKIVNISKNTHIC